MDRIIKDDSKIIVSQDRTRYNNVTPIILKKWYPNEYKTMKLKEVNDEDGYINYVFDATYYKEFDIEKHNTLDKLKCAYGLFQYESLFINNYQTSFDDNNIYLDSGDNIELLFVEDVSVYEDTVETSDFLVQLKARILAMFSKYSFDEIVKSDFTLNFSSKFENEVLQIEDVETLKELISSHIKLQEEEHQKKYIFVKKRGFITYRVLTYTFLMFFLLVSTFSIFNYTVTTKDLKFDNTLYSEFVDKNYIEVVRFTKGEKLNSKQKFLVGYSAIMTSTLDDDKRKIILSTYTPSVSDSIKEYWIYIGYGDYNKAINKGKSVNNDEYVLYALRLEENRLLNDDEMDGAEKETQLKNVQDSINTYEERLGINEEEVLDDE